MLSAFSKKQNNFLWIVWTSPFVLKTRKLRLGKDQVTQIHRVGQTQDPTCINISIKSTQQDSFCCSFLKTGN